MIMMEYVWKQNWIYLFIFLYKMLSNQTKCDENDSNFYSFFFIKITIDYIMMIQWISFWTKEKKMKRRIWNEIDQHTHTQIICIDPFNHYYYEIELDEWMNEDETTKKNWLTKKDRSAFSVLVWVKKKILYGMR